MEGQVKGLIMGIIGLIVFALVLNIAVSIYAPSAVKSAVQATTDKNYTIDGVTYTALGNGQSAQQAVQDTQDNINVVRTTANILLGVVFLVLIILAVVDMFKGKKHY